MVVMAIIAILSTAGISQYGNFIKTARDSTRIADLNAINVALLQSIQSQWTVPDDAALLATKIKEVAGKYIVDPLDGKTSCIGNASLVECRYKYKPCDGGTGYILATSFESKSNADSKYTKDDVSTSATTGLDNNLYEIGNCDSLGTSTPFQNIWRGTTTP